MHKSLLPTIFLVFCISFSWAINDRPIIGILTQPGTGGYGLKEQKAEVQYIAASYVKFIESAGARVVPIFYNSTYDQLDQIFDSINGVFFPGGGADLNGTKMMDTAQYLFQKAMKANDQGDFFPIEGHCMGFEVLAILASDDENILTPVDAENISMPLYFKPDAKNSFWLQNIPEDIYQNLQSKPITLNNHRFGVSPADFESNSKLNSFFRVLSTNYDREGKEFISLWEGNQYPFLGMQWHAEKPQFEWNPNEDINHSLISIQAMQYFANFFVDSARRSSHRFSSSQVEFDSLIYNYAPVYSASRDPDFEQVYIFQ